MDGVPANVVDDAATGQGVRRRGAVVVAADEVDADTDPA